MYARAQNYELGAGVAHARRRGHARKVGIAYVPHIDPKDTSNLANGPQISVLPLSLSWIGSPGNAPPDFTETGLDQQDLVLQDVLVPQTMKNVVNKQLLEHFPLRKESDSFGLRMLEASGFGFDGVDPDLIQWSYGILSRTIPNSLKNATTMDAARSVLKAMPATDLESIVVYCDYPGASFHTGSMKGCNNPIPTRGWGRQQANGFEFKVTSLIEVSAFVSNCADETRVEKCCLATVDAAMVVIKLHHSNGVCTPLCSSLVLFVNGPLGQLADARTHVNVVPSVIQCDIDETTSLPLPVPTHALPSVLAMVMVP